MRVLFIEKKIVDIGGRFAYDYKTDA
jgi:hypothetical protein